MPTFNRAPLIKGAIESTIYQTYKNWELIIIDDGSTDNTESIVQSYSNKDNRIKYFKNTNKGGAAARNYGISLAKGEYIAFLDDDDISLPRRFESQLNAAIKNNSRFIVSGYEIRDRKTNKIKAKVKLELKGAGAGFPSRWLIKKELLEEIGGFDEDYPSMQDIEISYRLSEHEIFSLHDDIVSVIYPSFNSVSTIRENAIKGKIMLVERLGSKMPWPETARWYFIIGAGFYNIGDKAQAITYFKTALKTNNKFSYRLGYIITTYLDFFGILGKKLISKILHLVIHTNITALIVHPVIK